MIHAAALAVTSEVKGDLNQMNTFCPPLPPPSDGDVVNEDWLRSLGL
jgi:hypothetical protein